MMPFCTQLLFKTSTNTHETALGFQWFKMRNLSGGKVLQALCEVFLCVCMCALELPVTTREGTKFKLVFVCMPVCFRLKNKTKQRYCMYLCFYLCVYLPT